MVERGLAESREKAQALIMAGEVRVDGQKASKPGHAVDADDARVEVLSRPPYVSRGGFKLAARAASISHIDVTGKVCLDVGLVDRRLHRLPAAGGAARVHAVDCGTGQLDWKLRTDPRVVVHEGVNARDAQLRRYRRAGRIFLCCDVSFISVTLILPAIVPLLRPAGANGYTDQTAV